jgi:hypothetical protein
METKGQKSICNVKTQWVSMLAPSKHACLNTNHFLWGWVKTTQGTSLITKTNYGLFCDIDVDLGLKCVLPMLELVQSLSKMLQVRGTFNQAHCVQFLYHVCRPSRKGRTTPNFKSSIPWWTIFVMFYILCGGWNHRLKLNIWHSSFIIGCQCYTRHIQQLERCLWWTWLIGNM